MNAQQRLRLDVSFLDQSSFHLFLKDTDYIVSFNCMHVIMKHLNYGTDGIAHFSKCLLYIPASSYVRCKNLNTSISQRRKLINCLCNSLFTYTQKRILFPHFSLGDLFHLNILSISVCRN